MKDIDFLGVKVNRSYFAQKKDWHKGVLVTRFRLSNYISPLCDNTCTLCYTLKKHSGPEN